MIGLATYYSAYFEYFLPMVNSRYTGDWADVFLYFLGGSGYYLFNPSRPPVRSSPDS